MELKSFEEFLERRGQLTRIQVNILQSDLELLNKYAAYVTKSKKSRLTVADLCQLAIHDCLERNSEDLINKMGDFEYIARSRSLKKENIQDSMKRPK